jgi:hypothetical protein
MLRFGDFDFIHRPTVALMILSPPTALIVEPISFPPTISVKAYVNVSPRP